jgi:hypothetical protein
LRLNLSEMRVVADEFERQVSLAVRDNAEVLDQIQQLEQRYDEAGPQQPQTPPEFPPTGAIIDDLENFLKSQRDDDSTAQG